jgi:hypothetical protein
MYITIHYSRQLHNTNYKTGDIQERVLRTCLLSCDPIFSQALTASSSWLQWIGFHLARLYKVTWINKDTQVGKVFQSAMAPIWDRLFFDDCVTMHPDTFLYNKPTRCTNFSNLFWKETLHVSDSSCVHHQFFTVHTWPWYMSYRFADSPQAGSVCSILILLAGCQKNLYDK